MKLFVVLFYYPDDDGGGYIEEYHSVHDVLENAREIVKKSIEEEKEKYGESLYDGVNGNPYIAIYETTFGTQKKAIVCSTMKDSTFGPV